MHEVQDFQNKIQQILDIVNEGEWHPEVALRVLTASLGSIALAVNVPLEALVRESGNMFTELYSQAEEHNSNVQ